MTKFVIGSESCDLSSGTASRALWRLSTDESKSLTKEIWLYFLASAISFKVLFLKFSPSAKLLSSWSLSSFISLFLFSTVSSIEISLSPFSSTLTSSVFVSGSMSMSSYREFSSLLSVLDVTLFLDNLRLRIIKY